MGMMKLTDEQRQLVADNHGLIYHILKQKNLSIDEYYDAAAIGLCKAASTFDESKSKFATYACIVMLNEIRMGFRQIKRQGRLMVVASLDDPVPGTDGAILADIIPSIDTPETCISALTIQDCVRTMGPKQRQVIELAMQGLRQHQIAEVVGISQPYVARLLKRAKQDIAKKF